MNVLVTGATGFIGSHLTKRLVSLGHKVSILTRYNNVVHAPRLQDVYSFLNVIECDIRHRSRLMDLDIMPDVVFHLAAYNHVGQSFEQQEEVFETNVIGAINVLDAFEKCHVIFMSSSEIYGNQRIVPTPETVIPNPESPYALSKYVGELHARIKSDMGHRVSVVRSFNAFGEYQSTKAIIPRMILSYLKGSEVLIGNGKQTRDFNYVSNVVDGLISVMQSTNIGWKYPINICSGVETNLFELSNAIHEIIDKKGNITFMPDQERPTEVWRMAGDSTIARQKLAWVPKVPFIDGLRKSIEWYKCNLEKV